MAVLVIVISVIIILAAKEVIYGQQSVAVAQQDAPPQNANSETTINSVNDASGEDSDTITASPSNDNATAEKQTNAASSYIDSKNEATNQKTQSSRSLKQAGLSHLIAPVIYGDTTASVIIEEFASFTCSHCAHFHKEILPQLQQKYLNNGKAQLHMYSFIRNAADLRASMLIQCLSDNDKRQKFVKALLQSQEQWAYSPDFVNNLRVIAQVGGVSNSEFDTCINNKELEDALLKSREIFINERDIKSTPFFVIGKYSIKGVQPISAFDDAIAGNIK